MQNGRHTLSTITATEFAPITVASRSLFEKYLNGRHILNCDTAFANIYCWQDTYRSEIAECDGFLLVRFEYGDGETCYMQPVGSGSVRNIVQVLIDDAAAHGSPLRIVGLTPEWRNEIEREFPSMFAFSSPRSTRDYIYLSSDLATLPGRRYQSKRNHINRFKAQYAFRYEPLSAANIPDCMELNGKWTALHPDSPSEQAEQAAMRRAFARFDELGLRGGVLYADGRIAAFTYGSAIDGETFCTHVEKVDTEIEGAGAMINQLFAQSLADEYRYINREEDLGLEGLRFSKLSYHPAILLEKISARMLTPRERQIRTLWQEAFGDSREFADDFLIQYYNPALCLTRSDGGRTVAMLHIVPMNTDCGRMAYIYAVATDAGYRRRGYASALLDEALSRIGASGEYDFAALIPGSEESRRLYAAFGFEDTAVPITFGGDFDFGTGDKAQDLAMIYRAGEKELPKEIKVE